MGVLTQYEADQMADGPTAPLATMPTNRSVVDKPAKPGRKADGTPKLKAPSTVIPDLPAPAAISNPKTNSVAADSMRPAAKKIAAKAK